MEHQPDALPTNKALVASGTTALLLTLIDPAVREVWPQIAPAVLTGDAFTALVAGACAVLGGLALAWVVPDRAGTPR